VDGCKQVISPCRDPGGGGGHDAVDDLRLRLRRQRRWCGISAAAEVRTAGVRNLLRLNLRRGDDGGVDCRRRRRVGGGGGGSRPRM
jgi:hypothetical protein